GPAFRGGPSLAGHGPAAQGRRAAPAAERGRPGFQVPEGPACPDRPRQSATGGTLSALRFRAGKISPPPTAVPPPAAGAGGGNHTTRPPAPGSRRSGEPSGRDLEGAHPHAPAHAAAGPGGPRHGRLPAPVGGPGVPVQSGLALLPPLPAVVHVQRAR